MLKRVCFAATLCLFVAGCVTTQEMPLAPNVVRLDTHASGLLSVGQTTDRTMKRAAELTLQNGYSHFRLDQVAVNQSRELGCVYSSGQATSFGTATGTRVGNTVYVNGSSVGTGYGMSTPIYRPTSDVGVTVYMFRANEPGAQGAFDAKQV